MKSLDLIKERKSELAFAPVTIKKELIDELFEVARWAPSAYNEQPWKFYYAVREDVEAFSRLVSVLATPNAEWAKNASVIVFSFAKKTLTLNGKPNSYAMHDTGMATYAMLLHAQSLGLVSHVMGGFDRTSLATELGVNDDFMPVAAIALGYKGNNEELSSSNYERIHSPRVRKEIIEFAHRLM